ncbi:hypothetical protein LAZ67_17003137 [Cordylochernes scorpioides]|uniref:Uncharacterized protein n=1 Tax=Cordylochernes scorpioides TaxID=51811 RepID=A0ABY6LEK5_9ARAC|nr:hypothetical protein LAZ67_17003137 [Cordylochernes scorpioides]
MYLGETKVVLGGSGSYHRVPLSHVIAALPCDCPSRGRQCRYCKGLQPPNCPAPLSLRVHYAAPVSQHRWRLRSVRLRPLESGGISLQDWVLHLSQLLDLQGRTLFYTPRSGLLHPILTLIYIRTTTSVKVCNSNTGLFLDSQIALNILDILSWTT